MVIINKTDSTYRTYLKKFSLMQQFAPAAVISLWSFISQAAELSALEDNTVVSRAIIRQNFSRGMMD
jgi:hypothetical protein